MTMKHQMKTNAYYEVEKDLKDYPDAWCYVIVGGRNTGKTYGALKHFLENNERIVFTKRTMQDVDTLCAGNTLNSKPKKAQVDLSPYKSINRDMGTNVKAYKIEPGLGGFYHETEEGAAGLPVAYLAALSAVQKIKGFDMSDAEALIFDEFIPQPWERINRKEGEQVMDLYKTISRDRVLRGRGELKLICLANAVNVWNPTCEILEITDVIADMQAKKREVTYLEERGIFIRMLVTSREMMDAEENTGIYKAMKNTQWGRMAFSNEFGYNDFSSIRRVALKGFRPIIKLTYKMKEFYIWQNEEKLYMCESRGEAPQEFDLDKETEQKNFYYEWVIDLQNASMEGRLLYSKYTMYDLITNYKLRFKV